MGSGPPAEVVVGVDAGTTATKVTAFGLGSAWRASAIREYPLLHPRPGWQVQEPAALRAAVAEALAECVAACRGARVVAISLSAALHGLLGVDPAGEPLTPLLTWADSRATAQADALRAAGLAEPLLARSGTPVHPMSPLAKLLWLREHEPAGYAATDRWLGVKDWVVLGLTGRTATELSTASATGLLDLATGDWSPRTLALPGLDGLSTDRLPPVLDPLATLPLDPDVARRAGLPAGTPVVLGAGDGPLGNLGTGALSPGVASLNIGTSAALRATVTGRPPVSERAGHGTFCYALLRDTWVVGGAVSNGGAVVRWAKGVFAASVPGGSEAELLSAVAGVPPGCEGLVAFPYLLAERAPLWDPHLTGAFLGVRHHHTAAHFARAAVEGVALQLWTVLDRLRETAPVTRIHATGGVFRSQLWRAVVADVLGLPVAVTDAAEGAALGAAALGLVALGRAGSLAAALAALGTGGEPVITEPAPEAARAYERVRSRIPGLTASLTAVGALYEGVAAPTAAGG